MSAEFAFRGAAWTVRKGGEEEEEGGSCDAHFGCLVVGDLVRQTSCGF